MPKNRYINSEYKTITCRCPRCCRKHRTYIYWTGNGVPRIYCKACRQIVENRATPEHIYVRPSVPARRVK